ncbi:MAG: FAD-dependent oxidoreductase, partial [Planctomycetota bacterium]
MASEDARFRLDRRGFLGLAACAAGGQAAAAGTSPERLPGEFAFHRNLPVREPYDVVVCGGGPSGIAAALAARRTGVKVLLVEGQGQLGGNGTSGLVSHWLGGRTSDCRRWVVGGIFRSLCQEAAQRGIALIPVPDPGKKYQPHGWYKGQLSAGIPFDPFGMAALLDEKMAAAEVDVLLLTQAVDVAVAKGRITHVVLSNKSGLAAVPASAVVDATGDADLAARSGCAFVEGRDSDGLMTPASLIFHVDNVDQDALDEHIHRHDSPRFREKILKLRKSAEWTFPYEIFISVQLQEKGTMMINTTRLVGIDGTDGASVTEGMICGRAEVEKLMTLMREHFPGFGDVRLKAVAPLLGVRETRRIRGRYILSVEDLAEGKRFEDTIGFSAYGWDLPDPKRPSDNPSHGRKL